MQGALRDFAHAGGDGRVLLVIAHRLDTVADTDALLVLDQGESLAHQVCVCRPGVGHRACQHIFDYSLQV